MEYEELFREVIELLKTEEYIQKIKNLPIRNPNGTFDEEYMKNDLMVEIGLDDEYIQAIDQELDERLNEANDETRQLEKKSAICVRNSFILTLYKANSEVNDC